MLKILPLIFDFWKIYYRKVTFLVNFFWIFRIFSSLCRIPCAWRKVREGFCLVLREPVARRADRRERRIKTEAKHLEDRPTLVVQSIRPKAFEEMGLGFCRNGRRPPNFGFVMHQTLLDTKSWLFLKLGTLSLLNSSQKNEKNEKIEKNF